MEIKKVESKNIIKSIQWIIFLIIDCIILYDIKYLNIDEKLKLFVLLIMYFLATIHLRYFNQSWY